MLKLVYALAIAAAFAGGAFAAQWPAPAQINPPAGPAAQQPAPPASSPAAPATPATVPPPSTLNVFATDKPDPPEFWTQLISSGVTAVLGMLGIATGGPLAMLIIKWLSSASFDLEEKARGRLKDMIGTALMAGAANIPKTADGQIPANRKNDLLNSVIGYVQMHGADTLKKLGAKPDSGPAVTAITGIAEQLLANKDFPLKIGADLFAPDSNDGLKNMIQQLVKEALAGARSLPAGGQP